MVITKNEIRKTYKEIRKSISDKKDKSISICKKVIKSGVLDNVKVLALYSAINDEVNLSFLFEYAKTNNITVLFPKVKNSSEMDFYEVDNLNQLHEQSFGIKEPMETSKIASPLSIDLMIVPLLAFDENCNRLGYGKGFYDRYFKLTSRCKKVGVAFKEQKCSELKNVINDLDVPLDCVFTD